MHKDIINRTFIETGDKLPVNAEIEEAFPLDGQWERINEMLDAEIMPIRAKYQYEKYSLTILSHEFLGSLKQLMSNKKINHVVELSCGAGWFTYWMKKYDIPLKEAVDNYSWNKTFDYLSFVLQDDSPGYVKNHPETDVFILSWPYMDNMATNIWDNMRRGQYLFYIGEIVGGCTASDEFFTKTQNYVCEMNKNMLSSHLSFFGLHDRPILYKK